MRLNTEKANNRLQQVTDKIVVIEYIPAKKGKTKFFDKSRNKYFEYNFFVLEKRLRSNPSFIPCPDGGDWENIWEARNIKYRKTCKKKYGVDNPSKSELVKKKKEQTTLKNYGIKYPMQSKVVLDKRVVTYKSNYGVDNPSKSELVKKKKAKSFSKYKNGHPLKDPEIRERQKETLINNGNIRLIEGKTVSDWAKEKRLHYQTVSQNVNKYGFGVVASLAKSCSSIEARVNQILPNTEIVKDKYLVGTNYKPDFYLPEYNLIVECDGLYWHSDAVKDNDNYHCEKRKIYKDQGIRSLFFREDEIRDKLKIVESIICNALGYSSKRIFARKTEIGTGFKEFFEENHLMGKGSGRVYSLHYGNELIASMQVKWVNKKEGLLEISRFCPKIGYSVVGGFSKLLSYVEKELCPKKIITYIDLRYGKGSYLSYLGFSYKQTYKSFKWTDFKNTFHRMRFKGNSGYELGLHKIWDCGQSKWLKIVV